VSSFHLHGVLASAGSSEFWDLLSISVGFPTPEKMAQVRQAYCGRRGCALIAAHLEGRTVGVIGYQDCDDGVELKHIAVSPDKQRSGIARALVQAVIEAFPDKGIYAETHDGAVGFYNRLGFQSDLLPPTP